MKSRHLFKLSTLGFIGLLSLAGCGGGGSDPDSSESGGTTYSGAASVGDMAEFTVNGSTLSYNLSGAHFGSTSGSLAIQPVNGTSGFYQSSVGSQTIGMMLAGNFGIAIVPNVPDLMNPNTTVNAFVTGLKNATSNEADVLGKTFLYVTYQTAPAAYVLKLNTDNSFIAQPVPDYLTDLNNAGTLNGDPGTTNVMTGCWRASSNGNYLNAVTSNDTNIASAVSGNSCGQFDFVTAGYDPSSTSSDYYRFMIKPGTNRAGLVVDMADGSGFGLGLETTLESSTPITAAPASNQLYSAFAAPNITSINLGTLFNTSTGASPFSEVLLKTDGKVEITAMDCDYSTTPISCNTGVNPTSQIDVHYDTFCYPNTNPNNPNSFVAEDMPGMACVYKTLSAPTEIYNALIDDQDGYFFAASLLSPEMVLGSR